MRMVFRCDPALSEHLPRPVPARGSLPDWLRAMPAKAHSEIHGREIRTVKQCPPFVDAMAYGVLILLPCDVIVDRGERTVIRKLANNASARFSDTGYSTIVARAEADDELTEILGLRIDLPLKFLRDLLKRATDAVRARLAAIAPPELQQEIARIMKTIAAAVGENSPALRDFSRAEALVKLLKQHNELNDAAIIKFAGAGKFEEVAASLAVLNNATTDMMMRLLEGPRSDLILIPCKSAGLNWLAVETLLSHRPLQQPLSEQTLKLAWKDYGKLSTETAQRTLRFWQVHNKIEK